MTSITLNDTFTIDGVRRTGDGYVSAFARVARTGIQEYRGYELGRPDLDVVRVYRPPEEVFAPDALHSFAHRPVTLKHPPVPVTAKNWKKYSRGQTGGEVVRDGEYVRVPMVMMDQALIDAFERDGIKQLSMGYSTDIKWRTGVVDSGPDAGQTYDAVQTAIRGNHLAVVPEARGGRNLAIGDRSFSDLVRHLEDMDDEDEDENGGSSDYTGDASTLYDTDFSAEQREHLAKTGAAMPGGGFPIRNSEDLHHAMQAIGRAKDPEAARAHIRERAKALGLESELSSSFRDAVVEDAWSDEARAAALLARQHDKSSDNHMKAAARANSAGDKKLATYHAGAANDHTSAAMRFQEAADHYSAGRKAAGDKKMAVAQKFSRKSPIRDSSPRGVDYVDCPECGAEVPPGTKDCPECGHKINARDGVDYMTKIIIDGVPVNVADEQTAAIIDRHVSSLTKQLADAKKEYDNLKNEGEDKDKEIEDAKKTISAKDGEIAVLKKQVEDAKITPEKLDVMVKDRVAVIDSASMLLDKSFSFDGKSVEAIRRAAVEAHLGDSAKTMDDAAIGGAFAALTKDAATNTRGGSQPIRTALFNAGGRQPVADARQAAYDEKVKRQSEAWRKPMAS